MNDLLKDDSGTVDEENVVYDVSTSGADFDVEGLVRRFERKDIFVPDFQRAFVWKIKQASRFIESILLGLPIPSIFLYRDDQTRAHLIVDGRQRLTTLYAFKTGIFPDTDKRFRLAEIKSRFNGKSYDELSTEDRRRFDDTVIHAIIIQQLAPAGSNDAVYHIFDRLNSNSTPALPQEIRSAIYNGPLQSAIEQLSGDEHWKKIFVDSDHRGKGQELILRFFALSETYKSYKKPMGNFLNDYMKSHRNLLPNEKKFLQTCKIAVNALGERPFRAVKALNVAVFDAFMVGIAVSDFQDTSKLRNVYTSALLDDQFQKLVSRATSDEQSVIGRIDYVVGKLNAA